MFLQVKDLTKAFGEKKAIDQVSFQVDQGELVCLLGPSGCGKSTVLNAIGGFLKLHDGQIILDGRDITRMAPEERDVSTVFQSYALFPHMTVMQNIIYGLKFKGCNKKEALELGRGMLETLNLPLSYSDQQVSQLSGGEQQRVALGRSLIVRPKLLLLDEPLSNLDAKLRVSMREEIRRIQKLFNITMIFVTHDQMEAFEIADQIVLLNEGRVMQDASAQELYNEPVNPFVLDFIGRSNRLTDGYIRPESIRIVEADQGQAAAIEKVVFQGAYLELVLDAPEGKLTAMVLNQGQVFHEGETVFIDYEKKDFG